jgi:glycosyltransferase involved in cell wall biosynthesis
MEPTPEVSVVMPVYNGAPFIQRATDSVLRQTFTNFELIIIDDGSTDRTPEILSSCNDNRIKIIRNPTNLGVSAAANAGLRQARSNLVARLDADDEMLPDRLAAQVSVFHSDPIDLCFCRGWKNRGAGIKETHWRELEWSMTCWRGLFTQSYGMHSASMINREKILSLGGYDERFIYAEDYELWDRCLEHRMKFKYLPQPLIRYYFHPQNASSLHSVEQANFARQVSYRAMKRLYPDLTSAELRGLRWLLYFKENDVHIDDKKSGLSRIADLVREFQNAHPNAVMRLVWRDVAANINRRRQYFDQQLRSIIWPIHMEAIIRSKSVFILLSAAKTLMLYGHN